MVAAGSLRVRDRQLRSGIGPFAVGLTPGQDLPPEVEAGVRFHYGLLLTRAGAFDQGKRELERYARGGAHEPMLIQGLGLNGLHQSLLPKEVPAERLDAVTKAGTAARLWILGETDNAEAGFQELLKEFPTIAGGHYLYGTYLSSIRPQEAMAEFRRELELNPANADAGAMLALLLVYDNDPSGALPFAKKAAADRPADALVEYAYGKVLLAVGDLRAAIARLEAAEHLDPAALDTTPPWRALIPVPAAMRTRAGSGGCRWTWRRVFSTLN